MPFDPSSDARAVKTPLIQDSVRRLAIELGFEATQTPFHLSFLLNSNRVTRKSGTVQGQFLGNAAGCVLCFVWLIVHRPEPALELDLDPFVKRSGDICLASPESAWTFMTLWLSM
ncbi:hypothetical protein NC652_033455 [Populus alba x Populus x berolinensis]|nr:hypothetical protein NC652_033455 [Populus alba x Populus x berolinensis]